VSASMPRTEVATAQRVVHADIATVYDAIDGVERWPAWASQVIAPVRVVDTGAFDVTAAREGAAPTTHHVVVLARGPVSSLSHGVDGRYEVRFQIRPHALGADVEVRADELGKQRWWRRLTRRSRAERSSERLRHFLADLAAHLE